MPGLPSVLVMPITKPLTGEERKKLYMFANALRDVLDLEPLRFDGSRESYAGGRSWVPDEVRFGRTYAERITTGQRSKVGSGW